MAPIGSSSRLKATHCDSKGLPADAIKAAANARDVPYQSLIKVWLQEKVKQ
jgi:predicted DNA binding CopG/RHH family protein